MPGTDELLPAPSPLGARIHTVRGQAVMLDSDLAEVYEVETRALNKAVDRNPERFIEQFCFRLTQSEWENLMFQSGTSRSWGGRRKIPRVFTEHGAVMLATVLNSPKAIQASIAVIDAFVRLRRVITANRSLARRIDVLAEKVDMHDRTIAVIFHDLQRLIAGESEPDPEKPKGRIGFKTNEERAASGRAKRK